ncbi:uncharacterized protein HGUI_03211 [Hanseniaspora guilliermondii]|uniref:Protein kinase domain-containing protein n=1 Tax=Hanseniaspora guilliermondii TaxID=56406 RepID=A0A1L0B7E7_9ASCO|nr:uncharacterized protein HGUI_03211 [Hanseniaspora guilliermondii]
MEYTSFFNEIDTNCLKDLQTSFVEKNEHLEDISYNRLFQQNKKYFFQDGGHIKKYINKLIKKPNRSNPYINQYKLIAFPGKSSTTLAKCTNPGVKIKSAIDPSNELIAIKQYKKIKSTHNQVITRSHNNVSLKVIQAYMKNSRTSADQAYNRVQFDKMAWEFYVYKLLDIKLEDVNQVGVKNIVTFHEIIDSSYSNKVWFTFEYCQLGETQWEGDLYDKFITDVWRTCHNNIAVPPLVFKNYVNLRFLLDTLKGLSYINSKGIAHRDIKPSNILVQRDHNNNFVFKISDFETAVVTVDKNYPHIDGVSSSEIYKKYQNEVNKLIGSPMFIAPEICGFACDFDESNDGSQDLKLNYSNKIKLLDPMKFDCWALGISLHCLLQGKKPFDMELGGTEFELYKKINQEDLTEVFKNKDTYGKIYDVTAVREELLVNEEIDEDCQKMCEICMFLLMEVCDQLLVKDNSLRKSASELLSVYSVYFNFIENNLRSLVESSINENSSMNKDILNLVRKSPFKLKSNTSLLSNSSYSNSGESLNIVASPIQTLPKTSTMGKAPGQENSRVSSIRSTSGKFKKIFQIKPKDSSSSDFLKTPEKKLEISLPISQQYLPIDSPNSPLSMNKTLSSGSNIGNSNLQSGNGKYIDLKNFVSSEEQNNANLKQGFARMTLNGDDLSSPFEPDVNCSDDGMISITSTESEDEASDCSDDYLGDDQEYVEFKANGKKEISKSAGSSKPSSAATQYGYNKLNLEEEVRIEAPKRSSMRLKKNESDVLAQQPPVATLKPSAKTIDFKKFLNIESGQEDKTRKKNRLTVLNIRDSILNFENVDALKKYLNFAENGDYNS